ncbi:enoyl-CoA hydratase-related protein [Brevibacterium daeguense]|uniref:Enoyl-CoA hydratase-related protein n=1 Tax=Brevibacterium daeguense TaxID=909936 RepID=A0ABP8EFW8_9MICO|nr:enoyl-CoA hydratase-related protein [Brevibacterium daeguense]
MSEIKEAVYQDITYEESDHVGVLTINRPEKHNALRFTTYDEIEEVVRTTTARALIITGAGRSFCSGDDLQEVMMGTEAPRKYADMTPLGKALLEADVPIIAAVNGAAVGWGMELCLLADLRIASARARFGEIFVKRGLVPDVGGMTRLESIVGRQQAMRLLLTGDIIDAAEAQRIGLVLDVVEPEALLDSARALAGSIAANPPLAVRRTKAGLRLAGEKREYEEFGRWFSAAIRDLKGTRDHKESVAAFLEKREPHYTGE